MFPSVNTDITTLGLPSNCEVAMVIYKYCILIKNTIFAHSKTLYKNYINQSFKEISITRLSSWSEQRREQTKISKHDVNINGVMQNIKVFKSTVLLFSPLTYRST